MVCVEGEHGHRKQRLNCVHLQSGKQMWRGLGGARTTVVSMGTKHTHNRPREVPMNQVELSGGGGEWDTLLI